jgi:uncharacterized protein (DUF58 family)
MTTAAYRLIDPSVLARIGNMELVARTVVEGFINGLHRSPHLGASMDFAEHRAYMPGDDIRRIDWRLYARTDRYYVKEFEADTNTNFLTVMDVSRSMQYAGRPQNSTVVRKIDYAAYIAACLAYFSNGQRDRVGLVTIDDDIIDWVAPSARHLNVILHTLERVISQKPTPAAATKPGNGNGHKRDTHGETAASPPIRARTPLKEITRKLADSVRRRCIIAIISDLYEEPEEIVEAMTYLRGKGNDLIVFHVLDRSELEFPFSNAASFMDLETGERLPIIPDYLRKQYREMINAHTAALSKRLGMSGVDYALFDTSKPLDHALFSYLGLRERLTRVR